MLIFQLPKILQKKILLKSTFSLYDGHFVFELTIAKSFDHNFNFQPITNFGGRRVKKYKKNDWFDDFASLLL